MIDGTRCLDLQRSVSKRRRESSSGKPGEVDRRDRQVAGQLGLGAPDLVLGFGELALQLLFVGSELRASVADLADERLAGVAGDLQSADRSAGLGVRLLTNKFFN